MQWRDVEVSMERLLVGVLVGLLCFVGVSASVLAEDGGGGGGGRVVLKKSANGSRTLRPFTVQDGWEARWESTADISLYLLNEKGDPIESLASTKKAGNGSTYHQKGGRHSIKIISLGEWTVSVVQVP
jgi:hypothetical protein